MVNKNLSLIEKKIMNKKGFTLVELLVVIAIIGLLSTIAVVSLGGARAKARDAKRIADLRSLQSAFETYLNSNNTVNWTNGNNATGTLVTGGLISAIPVDPDSTKGYTYCASGTTYLLSTILEGTKPTGAAANAPITNVGTKCNAAAGGTVPTDCSAATAFCVTNAPAGAVAF